MNAWIPAFVELTKVRKGEIFGDEIHVNASPPNVFIGGPVRTRLDSRLKHAGMTESERKLLRIGPGGNRLNLAI